MVNKKDLIIVGLATFCLTVTLFLAVPTRSLSPAGKYDPFIDLNNDGRINILDAIIFSNHYQTGGTPAVSKLSMQYDSGWMYITQKCGDDFIVTHNLNSTDIIVDITGKTTIDGGVHQRYLGLTNHLVGWSKTCGEIKGDTYEKGSSVVRTSDGGYAVVGYTQSVLTGYDVYLVKMDSVGNVEWNKTYGGELDDFGFSVIQTSDGGYAITGYTKSFWPYTYKVYLVKTDSMGNMQWNKTYGGIIMDFGYSVVQTTDGGYAIAGYTYSYGAGQSDVYLVKTNSTGDMQWNKTYGGTDREVGYSVVQTSDGGYAIAGYTEPGDGMSDVYLVKTDSSGNMQWNKTYNGGFWDYGYSVVQTSDGGYAIAGYKWWGFTSDYTVYFVKTDSAGNMQWSSTYGGLGKMGGILWFRRATEATR